MAISTDVINSSSKFLGEQTVIRVQWSGVAHCAQVEHKCGSRKVYFSYTSWAM